MLGLLRPSPRLVLALGLVCVGGIVAGVATLPDGISGATGKHAGRGDDQRPVSRKQRARAAKLRARAAKHRREATKQTGGRAPHRPTAAKAPGSGGPPALALAAVVGLIGGTVLAARRAAAVRAPTPMRFWLFPYRADEAPAEAVERVYRAWHAALSPSVLDRLRHGSPALGLEFHADETDGGRRVRLMLACPVRHAGALRAALQPGATG